MRRKRKLTVAEIERAYRKAHDTYASLQHADNPQLVAMRQEALGAADAFEAVLQALRGDFVLLDIFSRERKGD